ncbi:MAG TPA: signal peptidase II [Bryobacteraceae bacterium]|nr:signal peptidase II [Bryobacteraceae bacterium]
MTRPGRLLAFGVAFGVFLLDRITKLLIQRYVAQWDTYTVIPGFFNIIHTENPGAAFSLFADAQSEWRTFFLVGLAAASLVLIGFLLWHPGGRLGDGRTLRIALALIMGGALGNVYDRILQGAVTDFLDLYINGYHWPAFNIADMGITIGTALVLLDVLRSRRHEAIK